MLIEELNRYNVLKIKGHQISYTLIKNFLYGNNIFKTIHEIEDTDKPITNPGIFPFAPYL